MLVGKKYSFLVPSNLSQYLIIVTGDMIEQNFKNMISVLLREGIKTNLDFLGDISPIRGGVDSPSRQGS